MLLNILVAALAAAFGVALAFLQRDVRQLKQGNWAQHRINRDHTESIGILDVCTQTMGERVAKSAELIDQTAVDVHRLVVVVGGTMHKVKLTDPKHDRD